MTKDIMLHYRIDTKLYDQLVRYAKRNDNSNISVSARRALEQFLNEEEKSSGGTAQV